MFCNGAGYHHIRLLLPKMNKCCMKEKNRFSFTSLTVSFQVFPEGRLLIILLGNRDMAQCPYPWPALQGCERISTFSCALEPWASVWNSWGSSTPSWNSLTRCDEQLTPASSLWHIQSLVMSHVCGGFLIWGTPHLLSFIWGLWQRKAEAFNLRSLQEGFKGNIFLLLCTWVQVPLHHCWGGSDTLQTQKGPLKHLLWLGCCSCPYQMFQLPAVVLSPQVTSVKNRWPAKDDCARDAGPWICVLVSPQTLSGPQDPQESCGKGLSYILEHGSSVFFKIHSGVAVVRMGPSWNGMRTRHCHQKFIAISSLS